MSFSPSTITLMKRIFLTLGILLFAGGTYHIGQNYTLVQVDSQGLASSVLSADAASTTLDESKVVFRVGSFVFLER